METKIILSLGLLNCFLLLVLIILFLRRSLLIKDEKKEMTIVVFDEVQVEDGFLKKSIKVKIKQQFYYKGIPVGGPTIVAENNFETVDKDRVENLLKDYAKPLMDIGVAIIEFKSGKILGSLKK